MCRYTFSWFRATAVVMASCSRAAYLLYDTGRRCEVRRGGTPIVTVHRRRRRRRRTLRGPCSTVSSSGTRPRSSALATRRTSRIIACLRAYGRAEYIEYTRRRSSEYAVYGLGTLRSDRADAQTPTSSREDRRAEDDGVRSTFPKADGAICAAYDGRAGRSIAGSRETTGLSTGVVDIVS